MTIMESNRFDLIVVGAGLAGMTAAATAADRGLRVALVSTGFGMFVFGAGCIADQPLAPSDRPDLVDEAIGFFTEFSRQAGCPFEGTMDRPVHLPTILGSFQTVSLAPFYLWNGTKAERAAVVGIEGLSSFDATFVCERLNADAKHRGQTTTYTPFQITLSHEDGVFPSTLQFANRFDRDARFRQELVDALKPVARSADVIMLPGLLGLRSRQRDIAQLEKSLGCGLCELPTLPPSVPGLRLSNALERHLRQMGVEFLSGFPVSELTFNGRHCDGVVVATPGRPRRLSATSVILASGPFSAGLLGGQPSGFDDNLRPLAQDGAALGDNLYAIGALLSAGRGRAGNQRAILTGYRAGKLAAGQEGRYAAR